MKIIDSIRKLFGRSKPEDLEGKKIVVYRDDYGFMDAIVAGCEKGIGITLVNKEDKEQELYCMNYMVKNLTEEEIKHLNKKFDWIVDRLKEGMFDLEEYQKTFDVVNKSYTANCAFR